MNDKQWKKAIAEIESLRYQSLNTMDREVYNELKLQLFDKLHDLAYAVGINRAEQYIPERNEPL